MTWAAVGIAGVVTAVVILLLGRVLLDLARHTFPRLFVKPHDFDDDDDRAHWMIR